MSLTGTVALVTGAGSGIGYAAARKLAREGASVASVGHKLSDAEDLIERIEADGGRGIALEADVEDASAAQDVISEIRGTYGRLDTVVASAGINGVWASLEDLEPQEWKRTIDVNLTGTFFTVKYAVPLLKEHGGSVVIVSSINGTRTFSNTGASAYSATKAAQVAFAKMVAVELASHKIRVNAICPGAIDTEIDDNTEQRGTDDLGVVTSFPDGPIPLTGKTSGTADQVADLIHFLASPASSHITGTEMWIDGGQSLVM